MTGKIKKYVCAAWIAVCLLSVQTAAAEQTASPYETLRNARQATHAAGSFRFSGTQTTVNVTTLAGKTTRTARYYQISGYDIAAAETYIQLDTRTLELSTGMPTNTEGSTRTAMLLRPDAIYGKTDKTSANWVAQDFAKLLTQFTTMGVLDQFFMLELLNSDRLSLYEPYMAFGSETTVNDIPYHTVSITLNQKQYAALIEAWTADMAGILGEAAQGMSEQELTFMQLIMRRTLTALDAKAHYIFYITQDTGRIAQIDITLDTANPSGSREPGAIARVQSTSSIRLYDFGQPITRIAV